MKKAQPSLHINDSVGNTDTSNQEEKSSKKTPRSSMVGDFKFETVKTPDSYGLLMKLTDPSYKSEEVESEPVQIERKDTPTFQKPQGAQEQMKLNEQSKTETKIEHKHEEIKKEIKNIEETKYDKNHKEEVFDRSQRNEKKEETLIISSRTLKGKNIIVDYESQIKSFEIATKPRDGTVPQIYSTTVGMPPNSYLPPDKLFDRNSPPPTYVPYVILSKSAPTTKDEIFRGLEIRPQGGLVCTDKEILDKQKGVVKDVSKQILAKTFGGGGVVSISLPVRIFEPRSVLERLIDFFALSPVFLKKAAVEKNHLERLKHVISFAISGLYGSAKQLKPFNPYLGETYQAYFPDGTEIYCEHTSHHPPISNFHFVGFEKSYEIWGSYELQGSISGNTLKTNQKGPTNIRFPDGQHIVYTLPTTKLGGMLWGARTMLFTGNMVFEDLTNNISAVVIFKPHKKAMFKKVEGKRGRNSWCNLREEKRRYVFTIKEEEGFKKGFSTEPTV